MADNASTNDTLCREIEEYLEEEERIKWDAFARRLRCSGHIINLSVQAFLFQAVFTEDDLQSYDRNEAAGREINIEAQRVRFRLLGPLGKLHNIVVHIRGSALRTKEWIDLAKRMLPLDNRIRWNC